MPDALPYQWLNNGLLLGSALLSVGVVGLVARRNLTVVLLSAGIMAHGSLVALLGSSALHHDAEGRTLAVGLVIVMTLSLVLGGVLATMLHRGDALDLAAWNRLHDPALPDSDQSDEPTVSQDSITASQESS